MSSKKFIIEHLEPRLWRWSLEEYRSASEIVGKSNLIFTNCSGIAKKAKKKLEKLGKVVNVKAEDFLKNKNKICILDPKARKKLEPKEAKKFDYFVFGGILGDNPPKGRTKLIKIPKAARRNLGKIQMSTDNAIAVVKRIVAGARLADLKFIDAPEILIKNGKIKTSVILPFRYLSIDGKPMISKGIEKLIKERKF